MPGEPHPANPDSEAPPRKMGSQIQNAPHGMNLVIEMESGQVFIGRFDETNGFEVLLHDADVFEPAEGADPEHWIRETATYGVDVKHRNLKIPATGISRWRPLGDIEKLA